MCMNALQMGRIGEKLDIDFVISTGDNFYDNGLKGINDPKFEESFTKVYTAKSLQKQWYSGESSSFKLKQLVLDNQSINHQE